MQSIGPRSRSVTLLLIGALLGMFATCAHAPGSSTEADATPSQPAQVAPPAGAPTFSFAPIAEKAVPSVVNISTSRMTKARAMSPFGPLPDDPLLRQFFGERGLAPEARPQRQHSLGSGVIVSSDGVILTNNHVIDHADEIVVTLHDGRDVKAKLVGADAKSDLAVLRLEGKHQGLTPLPFGSSASLRLGDIVIAVGNPFGVGQTVTMGIVSAKGRSHMGIVDYEDFIQTDAAINPGNSGGALINARGELVGINTAILSRTGGSQGIGFAIPSDMARPIMDSLLEHGEVRRGWLGVAIQDLDDDLAKGLGLSVNKGVLISDVTADSPAAKAGLKRGDVVLQLNGARLLTTANLRNRVAALGPDASAELVILRDGKQRTVDVKLGSLKQAPSVAAAGDTMDRGPLAGVHVGSLTDDARARFQVPDSVTRGVVVTRIEPGSAASTIGLRPGDVIVELDRKAIDSVKDFERAYKADSKSVVLLVNRQGMTLYLALRR